MGLWRLLKTLLRRSTESSISASSILGRESSTSRATTRTGNYGEQKSPPGYDFTGNSNPQRLPNLSPYTTHPHITGYSKQFILSGQHTICRCAFPEVHGDAFTRRHHASAANGITFLSPSGQAITWERAAHAFLDALGADARASPGWHREDEALLRIVYHESTVRQIRNYHIVWRSVRRHGKLTCALEDDVVWHGERNPKGLALRSIDKAPNDGTEVVTMHGPWYGV